MDDIAGSDGHRAPVAPQPDPGEDIGAARGDVLRAHVVRPADAYANDDHSRDARSRLAAAIADARKHDGDMDHLQAILVGAMAELGTRDVWAALGVAMTSLRNGTLHGLRGDRWVSLKHLLATD